MPRQMRAIFQGRQGTTAKFSGKKGPWKGPVDISGPAAALVEQMLVGYWYLITLDDSWNLIDVDACQVDKRAGWVPWYRSTTIGIRCGKSAYPDFQPRP